ncbi:MAG: VWA domain-containing protein [Thermoanaerobaculia bacterium]|nr:VWA domain-containing protein [Thermoanaerobaculia bacterium]
MRRTTIGPILALVFGLALSPDIASPDIAPGAQRPPTGETIETVVVEVPVHVLDARGRPVRGLTAENFEIVDRRRKQTITGFEVIDRARLERVAEGEAGSIPVAARRHILLLFDLSLSDPSAIARARHAAMDMVNQSLHPSDLVAVATYSEMRGLNLVLGFSPDRSQVALAIDSLGLADVPEAVPDPLGLVIAESRPSDGGATEGGTAPGLQRGDAALAQILSGELGDLQVGMDRVARQEIRNRAMAMTRSLQELARILNTVDGRKHVVLFSEGMDSSVFFGTENTADRAALAEASARGERWRIDTNELYGSGASMSMLETMVEEFRRADAAIQAVDIGWLRADDASTSRGRQDALFTMANETGGELFSNFSDLGEAVTEVLSRTEVVYLLAFQPEDLELDGEYHRLEVELVGGPKGARLVHRPGYYAPEPFEKRPGLVRRLQAAETVLDGPDRGEMVHGVFAAPVRVTGNECYVPVLVELSGRPLLVGAREGVAAVELYGYAVDRNGRVADFFSKTLGLELAKVRPVLETSGLKYFGSLDLPPGEYALRVLARNAATGQTSRMTYSLNVPAPGAEAVMTPPMIAEPRGKWLMVLEEGIRERDYPFMLGDDPFLPAARPVLNPDSGATVSLLGFNLPPEIGSVTGELVAGDGSSEPVSVELVEAAEGIPSQIVARVGTGSVAPGDYELILHVGELAASVPVVVEKG